MNPKAYLGSLTFMGQGRDVNGKLSQLVFMAVTIGFSSYRPIPTLYKYKTVEVQAAFQQKCPLKLFPSCPSVIIVNLEPFGW